MPAVEAMQMGVPVVASRRGALPEVVGDAGVLVDPTDDMALARAIEGLLDDAQLRRQYAAAGRRQAARFSWSNSAGRLLEAYRDLWQRRATIRL
jgi:alpha-1,3-rhamnosyl/mannosyltransferase